MYKTALFTVFLMQWMAVLSGCGGGGGSGTGGTSTSSSSSSTAGSSSSTSGASTSSGGTGGSGTGGGAAGHACPTTAPGAIQVPSGATCLTVTPVETGASSMGQNAGSAQYALYPSPTTTAKGQLVLFMNGSGGDPAHAIATPSTNFYETAVSLGYAVLAVSYRSNTEVAVLCTGAAGGAGGCFYPTRQTLILGTFQTGAAVSLDDPTTGIRLDEGIADRAVLALEWLVKNDPGHPWSAFLLPGDGGTDPASRLDWSHIVAAGHSQGGGHATAIGKMFKTARVVQLSAPCDSTAGAPAAWLSAANGPWATDPSMVFYGLDATGDTICPTFAAAWQALGMPASRSNAAGMTCPAAPMVHNASIGCPGNAPNWQAMLQ